MKLIRVYAMPLEKLIEHMVLTIDKEEVANDEIKKKDSRYLETLIINHL